MSISLVVIRLELADQSLMPQDFQYCAGKINKQAEYVAGVTLVAVIKLFPVVHLSVTI